jgi:transaldolase/glucose-6-phosphate isomerase
VAESTARTAAVFCPSSASLGAADEYGSDRAFVSLSSTPMEPPLPSCANWNAPGVRSFASRHRRWSCGAEFLRWEFATAVAGAALAMNPFDEPNVREAKLRTQAQLDAKVAN